MIKRMSLQQPDPFLQLLAAAKCTSRARFKSECNTARQFIRVQVCKPTACSGHRMLLEHERNYGLSMGALVTVCSWNTKTELWFGHGCSGHRMLLEHERNYGLSMDALVTVCSWNTNGLMVLAWMLWSPYALGTRTELWFGHGCSGHRMLLEHERNYGLSMDALVTVCSWNTNGIMV